VNGRFGGMDVERPQLLNDRFSRLTSRSLETGTVSLWHIADSHRLLDLCLNKCLRLLITLVR